MNRESLAGLSQAELIAIILAQAEQIRLLVARVGELEARLAEPAKTPDNSSLPPSKGQKPNLPKPAGKKPRRSRPGVARALAERPDTVVDAVLCACPHCAHPLMAADQPEIEAYDHIDLPPIRPLVTRINRHRGRCPRCHKRVAAAAPEGFEAGSPFGPGLCALVLHLHITQAISFQRLTILLAEVFGVSISEGAIANILARAQKPLLDATAPIKDAVRHSKVVGSDETSARVGGRNFWQWVLLSSTAIYHLIADSRGAAVITDFMAGIRPEVWVADRYGGQRHHGAARQICLAHLLRDARFAAEAGDTTLAPGLRLLLLRAVAIGRRRDALQDATLTRYRADLNRRLRRLLGQPMPTQKPARRLFKALRRDHADLFRFITRRDLPYTNNACERALRPSVIFRRITNGFRSTWGAEVYANATSVIATGRLHGLTALNAIKNALSGQTIMLNTSQNPHPG